jgi:hypothetical protein
MRSHIPSKTKKNNNNKKTTSSVFTTNQSTVNSQIKDNDNKKLPYYKPKKYIKKIKINYNNTCHQKKSTNSAITSNRSNCITEYQKSQVYTQVLHPYNIQHNNISLPSLPYNESSTTHLPIHRFDHVLDKSVSDCHIQHLRHIYVKRLILMQIITFPLHMVI